MEAAAAHCESLNVASRTGRVDDAAAWEEAAERGRDEFLLRGGLGADFETGKKGHPEG